jgi:chromosome segregation ATPase
MLLKDLDHMKHQLENALKHHGGSEDALGKARHRISDLEAEVRELHDSLHAVRDELAKQAIDTANKVADLQGDIKSMSAEASSALNGFIIN